MEEALLDLLPGAPVYHLGLYRYVPILPSSQFLPTCSPALSRLLVNSYPPLIIPHSLAIARSAT